MKTLKVKLKQHTPLIHFQHDQYGATLRASEVKPKLDKYIIKHEFNDDFDLVKSFLNKGSKESDDDLRMKFANGFRALSYQIRIKASDAKRITLRSRSRECVEVQSNGNARISTKYVTEDFPMLLSNMGGKDNPSELVNLVLHNDVVMEIICSDETLISRLKKVLPKFFATTNFGQRASKGFGSFTVLCFDSEKPILWDDSNYYKSGCPYMGFYLTKTRKISDKEKMTIIMKVIDFYWKCLKSGINYGRNERYIKSFLYVYLNSELKKTWEKRKIKEYFNLGGGNKYIINPHEPIFARGILGCPDKYIYGGNREINVEHSESDNSLNKIARIPTPIYFKPVCLDRNKVYIYILFDENIVSSLKSIDNRIFKFSYNNATLDLNLDLYLNRNNYCSFIDSFHEYLSFDKRVHDALYSEKERGCYYSIYGDYDSFCEDDYGFVPKDFRWNDILYDDQCVVFNNVVNNIQ